MLLPMSDEELDRNNAALLAAIAAAAPPPPLLKNVEAALILADPASLELILPYRRRRFRVPPVSYRDGLALNALEVELAILERAKDIDAENLRKRLEILIDSVAIMWRLVRPIGWWERLTWRWRANPFEHAEAAELGRLFAFFCSARPTTTITWTSSARAGLPSRWQSIWPPASPSSSRPTRHGSTRKGLNAGIRFHGDAISSA